MAGLRLIEKDAEGARGAIESLYAIDEVSHNLDHAIQSLIKALLLAPDPPKRANAVSSVLTPLRQAQGAPLFRKSSNDGRHQASPGSRPARNRSRSYDH